jgi:hypothetical protein
MNPRGETAGVGTGSSDWEETFAPRREIRILAVATAWGRGVFGRRGRYRWIRLDI